MRIDLEARGKLHIDAAHVDVTIAVQQVELQRVRLAVRNAQLFVQRVRIQRYLAFIFILRYIEKSLQFHVTIRKDRKVNHFAPRQIIPHLIAEPDDNSVLKHVILGLFDRREQATWLGLEDQAVALARRADEHIAIVIHIRLVFHCRRAGDGIPIVVIPLDIPILFVYLIRTIAASHLEGHTRQGAENVRLYRPHIYSDLDARQLNVLHRSGLRLQPLFLVAADIAGVDGSSPFYILGVKKHEIDSSNVLRTAFRASIRAISFIPDFIIGIAAHGIHTDIQLALIIPLIHRDFVDQVLHRFFFFFDEIRTAELHLPAAAQRLVVTPALEPERAFGTRIREECSHIRIQRLVRAGICIDWDDYR